MKIKNYKCTICDSRLNYNNDLDNLTCSGCNASYEGDIFHQKYERKFSFRFKKYSLLIALLGALYLIYLAYRIFYY